MVASGSRTMIEVSLDKDAPEASNHTPSSADFTTTTPELKFSVHTGDREPKLASKRPHVSPETERAEPSWRKCPQKTGYFRSKTVSPVYGDRVVGATGIEPVTPTMSR